MTDEFLDLGQLETFLTVVEEGGFQKAARVLDVSQPHISQQIKRLERRLGHSLFDRTARAMSLTTDGKVLLIFVRALFKVEADIRRFFDKPRAEESIRVGLTEDFVRAALVGVLRLFGETLPQVQLNVVCDTSSARLFQQLDDGLLDLVVGKGLNGWSRGRHLVSQPMVWLAGLPHRAVPEVVPLVLPNDPSDTRYIILETLRKSGRRWQIKLQSSSLSTNEAAVKARMGICASHRALQSSEVLEMDGNVGLPPLPIAEYYIDSVNDPSDLVKILKDIFVEIVPALFAGGDIA